MSMKAFTTGVLCTLVTCGAHSACYTVYQSDQVVFQSNNTPVDLSQPLSQTVPAVFGAGAVMVFRPDASACQAIGDIGSRKQVADSQTEVQNALNALGQAYRHVGLAQQNPRSAYLPSPHRSFATARALMAPVSSSSGSYSSSSSSSSSSSAAAAAARAAAAAAAAASAR